MVRGDVDHLSILSGGRILLVLILFFIVANIPSVLNKFYADYSLTYCIFKREQLQLQLKQKISHTQN